MIILRQKKFGIIGGGTGAIAGMIVGRKAQAKLAGKRRIKKQILRLLQKIK